MSIKESIGWCDTTLNIMTGCSPVSESCLNCYARRMAYRLKGRYGYPRFEPFKPTYHSDKLNKPLSWKKSKRIFINSMSDTFHEDFRVGVVPWEKTFAVYDMMMKAYWHTFLILTKRPENAVEFYQEWIKPEDRTSHIHFGITIENQKRADERMPVLLQIPAAKRFVSVEPILGLVDFGPLWLGEERTVDCGGCSSTPVRGQPYCPGHDAGGIDWVIVGAETGPRKRSPKPEWITDIVKQCQEAGVPLFMKNNLKPYWNKKLIQDYPKVRLM